MVWSVLRQVFSTLFELLQIGRLSDQEKDLEILVLRKQLAMMEQQLDKPVRLSRAERLTLPVRRQVESCQRAFYQAVTRCNSDCPTGNRVALAS